MPISDFVYRDKVLAIDGPKWPWKRDQSTTLFPTIVVQPLKRRKGTCTCVWDCTGILQNKNQIGITVRNQTRAPSVRTLQGGKLGASRQLRRRMGKTITKTPEKNVVRADKFVGPSSRTRLGTFSLLQMQDAALQEDAELRKIVEGENRHKNRGMEPPPLDPGLRLRI